MPLQWKLIGAAILAAIMISGFFYIKSLRSELNAMNQVVADLKSVVDAKEKQLDKIQTDVRHMNEIQSSLNTQLGEIQNESTSLRKKFEEDARNRARDLKAIAAKKPVLVERAINTGTHDSLRCNEIVTGSPITEDEKSGKVKNTICQELLK